jgi:hypothetical protein
MKKYYVTFLLVPAVWLIAARWKPRGDPGAGRIPYGSGEAGFVGSAVCASCHATIYASHIKTAHYLDSRPASAAAIKGSFRYGHNRYVYNDHMAVQLEKKDGRFFQTALFNGNVMESEAFAIVIGSGRKGQTYLYWDGDRLFQLPISYYVPLKSWCNSPGYPSTMVYFGKQIPGQCIECHGTYAKTAQVEGRGTVFDSTSILYGIDCERCHGPGAEHVAWHTAHPGELTGRFIVNAAHLGRQQRLDACALCHSGRRQEFRPSFSFRVGDVLDSFSTGTYDTTATANLDVHGNQYGLLTESKCFRFSDKLDCQSCHDPHTNEYGQVATYSARCMNCHNGVALHSCSMPEISKVLAKAAASNVPTEKVAHAVNCVDCHMPALPSNKITLQIDGQDQPVHDLVRTHRVAIYPDIAREYLSEQGH